MRSRRSSANLSPRPTYKERVNDSGELRLGGYCRIPGIVEEPHVVVEQDDRVVGFRVFDRIRQFERAKAVSLIAAV